MKTTSILYKIEYFNLITTTYSYLVLSIQILIENKLT